jgi:hypothetical protein
MPGVCSLSPSRSNQCGSTVGTRTVTRSPPSGRLLSVISPPCPRTIERAMVMPSPTPPVGWDPACPGRVQLWGHASREAHAPQVFSPSRNRCECLCCQCRAGLPAAGDEFRTAPLWGLGQRLFFLHDGRTTDLIEAIQAHNSAGNRQFGLSEANGVVDNFNALSEGEKQDLLNFLRSL